MLLLAAGCVSPGGNQTATPTGATPAATPTVNETPARTPGAVPGTGTPQVTIISPLPYSAVTTTDVTIEVIARNFTPGSGSASGNVGNIIYYMDLEPLTAAGLQANMTLPGEEGIFAVSTNTSHTFTNVKPGLHNFSVELVHPDNTPFDPAAADIAEMIAVGPDATPPPTLAPSVVLTYGTVTATPATPSPTSTTPAGTVTSSATETTTTGTPAATETTAATVTTAATTAAAGGKTATVDLTAENIKFDMSTITVPAGAQVTVNFNNKDNGVPHNFAVYTDSSASQNIFKGDTITGPATTIYTLTAPTTPGTYFFRCDVHPQQMTGSFVVQ
ncbi:MAG: cupredoxin domain-containing protein [Methanomicrobiaceae archaeon]|nr:cupredoxin domain-containing protein [Methanomicrobiaceae archaeon]